MCDTLCSLELGHAIFAKNSDRPESELQLVAGHPPRRDHGGVTTQYLELPAEGPVPAMVLAQPTWLWGAEHGVNAHGLAVGNEKVFTTDRPEQAPAGLIGMDLVRLALERASSAEQAVAVITELLEAHGQGGPADPVTGEAYNSSFLCVDAGTAWVLETAGRSWVASPVARRAAISNRISTRSAWERGSADLAPGTDFDVFRDPGRDTANADRRLAATTQALATPHPIGIGDAMAALRDHGSGPWGAPGGRGPAVAPACARGLDPAVMTVCMHLPGDKATTSSMVVELPSAGNEAIVGWAAPSSPCVLPYLPFVLWRDGRPPLLPSALEDPRFASHGQRLRRAAERNDVVAEAAFALVAEVEAMLSAAAATATPIELVAEADRLARRLLTEGLRLGAA